MSEPARKIPDPGPEVVPASRRSNVTPEEMFEVFQRGPFFHFFQFEGGLDGLRELVRSRLAVVAPYERFEAANLVRLAGTPSPTRLDPTALSGVFTSGAAQLEAQARQATAQAARMRELATALASLDGYESTNDPRVFEFFLRHADAVDTLREVRLRLVDAFGPGIRLRLEPSPDDPDRLFVMAYDHHLLAEDGLPRLERELDAWWWTRPPEKTASFVIDLGWE